jgi:hypothetical protein
VHSWQSRGVDFEASGGKKDLKVVVVVVFGVIVVGVFVEREAGGDATAREGRRERRIAMRKGWHNERGWRSKRGAA